MATTERALQVKADVFVRRSEKTDFPNVCEGCLGENPYVRMQKIDFGGKCKMCERPYTMFKWRPGRGEGYRKTEICSTCSQLKNICQTCILDLQFGLPSQLRDSVLEEVGGLAPAESEVNKEFQAQNQLALLQNGDNPWQNGQTPNESLLNIARSALVDRSHHRVKITPVANKRNFESAFDDASATDSSTTPAALPLPPGVSSIAELQQLISKSYNKQQSAPASLPDPEGKSNPEAVATDKVEVVAASKVLPPRPAGPPPPWAFKNKPKDT